MGGSAFSTAQAAEVLGISRQAVHYLVKRGRLRAWVWGGRLCISRSSVYSYRDLRNSLEERKRKEAERGQRTAEKLAEEREKIREQRDRERERRYRR